MTEVFTDQNVMGKEGTPFDRAKKKLQKVISGNDAYVNTQDRADFEPYLDNQSPMTTVIMCSDSRVQAALLLNNPKGHLFTIRNIGNQVKTCEGSTDFGIYVLKTPLLLIIGHTDCGAVKAVMKGYSDLAESIKCELDTIHIGCAQNEKEALINNINSQVEIAVEKYKELIESNSLFVVGGIYDIQNIFGHGHGGLVFVNVNGLSSSRELGQHPLLEGLEKIKIIS